jgi:hypothetical protein
MYKNNRVIKIIKENNSGSILHTKFLWGLVSISKVSKISFMKSYTNLIYIGFLKNFLIFIFYYKKCLNMGISNFYIFAECSPAGFLQQGHL